ncbi:MAG: hypothetical protein ACP5NV_02530 [Candidatus Woesearchaeota archaeon]
MDQGKYIVLTVALVGLIGVGIMLFSGGDSIGRAYSAEAYEKSLAADDTDPVTGTSDFDAKLETSNTDSMQGDYVSFEVIPEGGEKPYHDMMLYCGDGTTVPVENIGSGMIDRYQGRCRYANVGKYEAYAIVYDSNKKQSATGINGNMATTNKILITITPRIVNHIVYAQISASDTTIREGEDVEIALNIEGALSPYRSIVVHCGEHDVTRYDYVQDTLSVTCEYNNDGTYSVYAEIYDFIDMKIISNVVDIDVDRRSGGGGSGGSSGGSGGQGACFPSWQCTSWSECINNVQTRTCTDIYDCDSTYKKPTESLECVSINEIGQGDPLENEQEPEINENVFEPEIGEQGFNWTPFVIIIVLVVLIVVYFIIVYPERRKYTTYIKKLTGVVSDARKKGYTDETIKAGLLSQGHKQRHIHSVMKKKR